MGAWSACAPLHLPGVTEDLSQFSHDDEQGADHADEDQRSEPDPHPLLGRPVFQAHFCSRSGSGTSGVRISPFAVRGCPRFLVWPRDTNGSRCRILGCRSPWTQSLFSPPQPWSLARPKPTLQKTTSSTWRNCGRLSGNCKRTVSSLAAPGRLKARQEGRLFSLLLLFHLSFAFCLRAASLVQGVPKALDGFSRFPVAESDRGR